LVGDSREVRREEEDKCRVLEILAGLLTVKISGTRNLGSNCRKRAAAAQRLCTSKAPLLRSRMHASLHAPFDTLHGLVLLFAYPDRVRRRGRHYVRQFVIVARPGRTLAWQWTRLCHFSLQATDLSFANIWSFEICWDVFRFSILNPAQTLYASKPYFQTVA
jgi:hypothetical protein